MEVCFRQENVNLTHISSGLNPKAKQTGPNRPSKLQGTRSTIHSPQIDRPDAEECVGWFDWGGFPVLLLDPEDPSPAKSQ